jgi:hypothetical protein
MRREVWKAYFPHLLRELNLPFDSAVAFLDYSQRGAQEVHHFPAAHARPDFAKA